jgi:hypothetical protein
MRLRESAGWQATTGGFAMKLTTEQRVVLAFFDAHYAGAMRCAGKWCWADDIKADPELAIRFLKDWSDEQRYDELLSAWLAEPKGAVRQ